MNVFKQFFFSFFNLNAYGSWLKQRAGKTFGFICICALLFSIILSANWYMRLDNFVDNAQTELSDVPDFSFENDKLVTDLKEPYVKTIDDGMTIYVNTNNPSESDVTDVLDQYEDVLVFLENRAVFKSGTEINIYEYSEAQGALDFDKQDAIDKLPALKALIIIPFIVLFIFFMGVQALLAAIVSAFVLLAQQLMKNSHSYGSLYTLSVYALVPMFVLHLVLFCFGLSFPLFLYIIIPLLYVCYALHLQKK
jgi:hypothetical protein